ncbi:hypothetical protein ACFL3N_01625 [Candidatus Omnitrophota bacterium]
MRRVLAIIVIFQALLCIMAPGTLLADTSLATSVSASVGSAFKMEFYEPDGTSIMFSTSVPFSTIDPSETFALPDGREVGDNKSDVGIICKSSDSTAWYLKIGITAGNLPFGTLKYYLSQPTMWDGTSGVTTDGTIDPSPAGWSDIPVSSQKTVYSSGSIDTVNTPHGTLCTINFQINPQGLNADTAYNATVTYTITTTA